MKNKEESQQHYETLVQNAQKGEIYTLKLKDDPITYTVIPMIHQGFDAGDEDEFTFKVLQPEKLSGVYKRSLDAIEELERK